MIPQKAKICPNCKLPQKGKFGRVLTILLVVIIAAWAFGMVYLLNSGDMDARFAHLFHRESVTAGAPVQTETTLEAAEEAAKETVKETGTEDIKVPAETEDILSIPVSGEELLAKGEKAEDTAETDVKEDGTENDTSKETDAGSDTDKESGAENDTDKDAVKKAIEETGSLLKPEESEDSASKSAVDKESETDIEDMADAENEGASDGMEMTRLVNTGDYTEEEFRELCTKIGYKKLLREKEEYLGAALMLEVTGVSQVDGGLFDDNIY